MKKDFRVWDDEPEVKEPIEESTKPEGEEDELPNEIAPEPL